MKYLVISPYFWPHIGGSQRYMEELYAHVLKRDPTAKVDVISYNTNGAPNKEKYRGMTIYRVPCIEPLPGQYAVANPFTLVTLLVQLSSNTYDIVHANTRFFESTVWAWVYARLIGAKSILTDHVAHHPIHPNRTITHIAKFLDVTVFRWLLSRYNLVCVTNTKTQNFLTNVMGQSNVVLTYGGVDTKLFKPAKSVKTQTVPYVRKRFKTNDIIVTFAGRLIKTKGILLFLDAVHNLLRVVPNNVTFVIAGDGLLSAEIAGIVKRKSFQKRVVMTGDLTIQEMRQLYKATDIFVHPSYHTEGFPNAVLEAVASGCFVIATNNAGTNEIITHKKTGLLIKQHDVQGIKRAIWWALTHKKQRNIMAHNSRIWTTDHFDWHHLVEQFMTLTLSLYHSPASLKRLRFVRS